MAGLSPVQRQWAVVGLFFLLAVGAFAFRAPRLDVRPLHTDEAVHTVKAGDLLERGVYIYDKHDYHGPTIYYAAFPLIWAAGADTLAETREWMFRLVPVLFGAGIILLLPLVVDGIGLFAAVVAGLLMAVSPAFVFYSRYYIQEMPLVFFTFGFMAFGWRYYRSGRLGWALGAGVFMGLMQATKETSVIAWTAMAVALGYTYVWWWLRANVESASGRLQLKDAAGCRVYASHPWWHFVAAGAVAVVIAILILTDFLHNPYAAIDAAMTYFAYIVRSKGTTPHDHPFLYYLQLVAWFREGRGPRWSEGIILAFAAVGMAAVLLRKNPGLGNIHGLRFLAVYTPLITLFYSAIPYKTPWCALTFLQAMTLLAGVGAFAVYRAIRPRPLRAVFVLMLAIGIGQLATQAYRASYTFCADTRNPYVYAHTSTNFMRLVKRIDDVAKVSPQGRDTLIKVITPDQWPLPWYLRTFTHVGYWAAPPDDAGVDAPIIVTSAELQDAVDHRTKDEYQSELYSIRPEVLVVLYIRNDLWDAYMAAKTAAAPAPGQGGVSNGP